MVSSDEEGWWSLIDATVRRQGWRLRGGLWVVCMCFKECFRLTQLETTLGLHRCAPKVEV